MQQRAPISRPVCPKKSADGDDRHQEEFYELSIEHLADWLRHGVHIKHSKPFDVRKYQRCDFDVSHGLTTLPIGHCRLPIGLAKPLTA